MLSEEFALCCNYAFFVLKIVCSKLAVIDFFFTNIISDHILFMIMYYIYMTKTARYEKRSTGDLGHLPKALPSMASHGAEL